MMQQRILKTPLALLLAGLVSFLIAGLSIIDMSLPRPYDGIVLETDVPDQLIVRQVVPDSGAAAAGIAPGDRIVGIERTLLESTRDAAELLGQREIGESIPYLIRDQYGVWEASVRLDRRRIGNPAYLYACVLGFTFFLVGLFVVGRQPRMRVAQIFFLLSCLFLLFLVCRLRPASYAGVDSFVLATGTAALLLLPPCFLHFFLIFPRPIWIGSRALHKRHVAILATLYVTPPALLAASWWLAARKDQSLPLISGTPIANWWLLAVYFLLGLLALAFNSRRVRTARERRAMISILFGSLFGLVPFLVLAVFYPASLHEQRNLVFGLVPLTLVPVTFAYAIVRFQILDIRVILRKSLLYTMTSAIVTGLYAVGIALFGAFSTGSGWTTRSLVPIGFGLAVVLFFESIRRRVQVLVDQYFFAERTRLRQTILEMGEALTGPTDLQVVVHDLIRRLPELLGLDYAALYLERDVGLDRVAGPVSLPIRLPSMRRLQRHLASLDRPTEVTDLKADFADDPETLETVERLAEQGVAVIAAVSSRRRRIGLVLLSGKRSQMPFDRVELRLVDGLLRQAAIALETNLLLEERTEQAELEREMEIAASVQSSLLPTSLEFGPGWQVAAVCRPAKHIGGDFYTQLPGRNGSSALIYGDVSGKSVSGALVMMAAHEVLHSLALTDRRPEQILDLANRRLYNFGNRRGFVAVAYLAYSGDGAIDYVLAGQPPPLLRRGDGSILELPFPEHRLPLGALTTGSYELLRQPISSGDLLLGYSDGVMDALDSRGEPFGIDRLKQVVSEAPPEPHETVQAVLQALDAYTRGTEQYDDLTLVALGRPREEPR